MIDGIGDLFGDEGFRTGLRFGVVTVLVAGVLGAALVLLRRGARPAPLAGVAFVVAGLLAVDDAFGLDQQVVVGLAVLAVCGFVATRSHPLVWLVTAVPGAVLFTQATEIEDPTWAFVAVLATTLLGGLLAADFDRTFAATGLPPAMFAFSVLGAYVTVPETGHIILLTGAALPLVVLGWPWPRPLASLGVGGSFAAVGLFSWIVVIDGIHRPGSVVGAITALGMFAVEPAVRRVVRRAATRNILAVAGLHVVVVGACSRVAGFRTSAATALVIAAVVYVLAAVALVVIEARTEDGAEGSADGGDAPGMAPGDRGMGDATARAWSTRGTSAFPHRP